MRLRPVHLGDPVGEVVTIESRVAQVTTLPYKEGWVVGAARFARKKGGGYRAVIYRCLLGDQCGRDRCLGHQPAVEALAATILKTYKRRQIR